MPQAEKERGSAIVVVTKKLRNLIKTHAGRTETVDDTLRRLLKRSGFREENDADVDGGRQLLRTEDVTTIRLTPMVKGWIHKRMSPGETVDHAIRRLAGLGSGPKRAPEREGSSNGTTTGR